MAYGYARGRSPEPDPRDVVEEAARAAGLSVEQFLERAAEDDREGRSRRFRPGRRRAARDLDDRRPARPDGMSEERVARILDDALESMQDTIRANEERTADAIAALGRKLEAGEPRTGRSVRAMRSDIERGFGREPAESEADPSLVRHLEDRISNVVSLIEERAKAEERRAPPPQPTDLRRADHGLERQIAALNQRIEALAGQMSERAAQREERDIGGAIDKLQQELQRLHAAPRPQPHQDRLVETLRSLDGKVTQLALAGSSDTRFDRLASELAALRAGLERQPEPDGKLSAMERHFETLGGRVDAIAEKLAGLRLQGPRDLRAQKSADAAFDELKRLIQKSAAPADDGRVLDSMRALERRLDAMSRPPQALAETFDRVQAIDRKLDTLARTPPEIAVKLKQLDKLESLERKLDAMQRAPDGVVERLDAIRSLVADRPQTAHREPAAEAALEAVMSKLDRLQPNPAGHHSIDRLHAEIQALSRKLEATAGRETTVVRPDPEAFERIRGIEAKLDALQTAPLDLAARLDRIQEMVRERPAPPAPAPALTPGVETLLRNLAVRMESMQSGAADDQALDRLHDEVREISRKLEGLPSAQQMPGFADLGGLERSISDLFGQIEHLRSDMGVAAEQAARRAANEVLVCLPPAAAPEPDETVRRQLDDIHAAQQEAERRADMTLGAVHETLKRVVDRLVDLEQDIKAKPAAPPPTPAAVSSPVITTAPLPALGAAPEPELPLERPPALRAEAASGSVASLRAQRLGVPTPIAAESDPAKGGIGSVLAAARGAVGGIKIGKGRTKTEAAAPPPVPQAPSVGEEPAAPSSLDLPLEPGSGRPRPSAARAPTVDAHDPKAHFLAAARRAAQAAAEQSGEALALAAAPERTKSKAVAARKGLSKKQVILLGLAALVVAVGATLQIMQAPPAKVEPKPDRVSNLDRLFGRTPQDPAKGEPVRTAQADSAPAATPRQILPPAVEAPKPQREASALTAAKPDDRVMSQPPRAAQPNGAFLPPDPSTVGSISAEPPKAAEDAPPKALPPPAPAASGDPLMRFEGVTGAERLKAAARAGDPSAFIELGNRHLEGRGAPRDLKTAALWFERAADFGSAPAQFRLGAMYREGRGVERNPKMAIKHFLAGAEAGNARAMYNAAVLLAEGVNGSPDYAAAGEWFKKAAEFGIRDSQYNLAILYARGLGLPQDLLASYAWFSAAAASGDEDAAKKRDEVAARLEPAKLAQAKAAAAAWKPKTPDPASNEVPTPPGGWDAAAGAKQVPAGARPERRI